MAAGNIKVIKPAKFYEPISKGIIYDKRIDAATLGLFVKVVGVSDKWNLNIKGLATAFGMSEAKVRTAVNTLESCGYLKRERVQGEGGKFCGWDYTFINLPTDIANNRHTENTDIGEIRPSENEGVYNNSLSYNENNNRKEKKSNNPARKFDLCSALISIGVTPATAADWCAVRKAAKAVDTETAFKRIAAEITKTGVAAEDCIALAVSKNWRGFEAEWYWNANASQHSQQRRNEPESVYAHNMRVMQELFNK